ncbi:MAG: hypothetical protein RL701_5011 [Pseudomonadota bacterium]|jgi:hypothetical protein
MLVNRAIRWQLLVAAWWAVGACRSGGAMSVNKFGSSDGQVESSQVPHDGSSDQRPAVDLATGTPLDPWSPGDAGPADLRVDVNTQFENSAISPWIYGVNFDVRDRHKQRWGIVRMGGNRSTAYNWENNASNAGSDYLFQNDSSASESDAPAKPLLDFIDAASEIDAAAIVTISNVDYVSADKNGGGDVRNSGPQYLRTRFKRNHASKGAPFTALPDPNDGDVYQDEFVAFLKARRPKAKLLLSMDNEPDLWSHTHAEVFSAPVTYADLWRRNHDFARAAKAVWPGIAVLGFVSYGYSGFLNLQNAADADGRPFLDWYLTQARAAERTEGMRLIDYLDLHWYPEAQADGERVTGSSVSPAVVRARVQAPRALWDPSYRETSWIQKVANGPIDLLHWAQAKIDRFYPGTKLAFSEWNFGGGNHISGAIAVADVLGIFGKHGVGVATYWPLAADESFGYSAFRAYRNYDGNGSSFADISVSAKSSRPDIVTAYASKQSDRPERTVILLINKDTASRRVALRIGHLAAYSTANVFLLTGAQPELRAGTSLRAVATNAFSYEMPALSVSVIVPQP